MINFNKILVDSSGNPVNFYLHSVKNFNYLKNFIESYGGIVKLKYKDSDNIVVLSDSQINKHFKVPYYSTDYVYDCITNNSLLDLNKYKIGPDNSTIDSSLFSSDFNYPVENSLPIDFLSKPLLKPPFLRNKPPLSYHKAVSFSSSDTNQFIPKFSIPKHKISSPKFQRSTSNSSTASKRKKIPFKKSLSSFAESQNKWKITTKPTLPNKSPPSTPINPSLSPAHNSNSNPNHNFAINTSLKFNLHDSPISINSENYTSNSPPKPQIISTFNKAPQIDFGLDPDDRFSDYILSSKSVPLLNIDKNTSFIDDSNSNHSNSDSSSFSSFLPPKSFDFRSPPNSSPHNSSTNSSPHNSSNNSSRPNSSTNSSPHQSPKLKISSFDNNTSPLHLSTNDSISLSIDSNSLLDDQSSLFKIPSKISDFNDFGSEFNYDFDTEESDIFFSHPVSNNSNPYLDKLVGSIPPGSIFNDLSININSNSNLNQFSPENKNHSISSISSFSDLKTNISHNSPLSNISDPKLTKKTSALSLLPTDNNLTQNNSDKIISPEPNKSSHSTSPQSNDSSINTNNPSQHQQSNVVSPTISNNTPKNPTKSKMPLSKLVESYNNYRLKKQLRLSNNIINKNSELISNSHSTIQPNLVSTTTNEPRSVENHNSIQNNNLHNIQTLNPPQQTLNTDSSNNCQTLNSLNQLQYTAINLNQTPSKNYLHTQNVYNLIVPDHISSQQNPNSAENNLLAQLNSQKNIDPIFPTNIGSSLSALEKSTQVLSEFIMQNSNSSFSNPISANSTSISFNSITSNYNISTGQNISISKNSSKSLLSSDIDYTFENIGKVSLSNDALAQDETPVLNKSTHNSSPGLNISSLDNNVPYTFENIVINTTQSLPTDCSETESPVIFTCNSKDVIHYDGSNVSKSDIKLDKEKTTLHEIDKDSIPASITTTRLESNIQSIYTFQSTPSSSENVKTSKSQSFDVSRTNNDVSLNSFIEEDPISTLDIRINTDSNSETIKSPLSPFKVPVESKLISNKDTIDVESRHPDFIFPKISRFNEHKENDTSSDNDNETLLISKASAINLLESNDYQAPDSILNPLPLDASTPNDGNRDLAFMEMSSTFSSNFSISECIESSNKKSDFSQIHNLFNSENETENGAKDEAANQTQNEAAKSRKYETKIQAENEAEIEAANETQNEAAKSRKYEISIESVNILDTTHKEVDRSKDNIDSLTYRPKENDIDSSTNRTIEAESQNEAQGYNKVDVSFQQETNTDIENMDEPEEYVVKDGEINETEIEDTIPSQQETKIESQKSTGVEIDNSEIIETQEKPEIEAEKAHIVQVKGADLESCTENTKNMSSLIKKIEIDISKECIPINIDLNFAEPIPFNKNSFINQEVISIEEDDNLSSQTNERSFPHRYKTRSASKIKISENTKKSKSKASKNKKHNSPDNDLRSKKNKRGRSNKKNFIELISSDHEVQAENHPLENNSYTLESPSLREVLSNSSDNCALSTLTSNLDINYNPNQSPVNNHHATINDLDPVSESLESQILIEDQVSCDKQSDSHNNIFDTANSTNPIISNKSDISSIDSSVNNEITPLSVINTENEVCQINDDPMYQKFSSSDISPEHINKYNFTGKSPNIDIYNSSHELQPDENVEIISLSEIKNEMNERKSELDSISELVFLNVIRNVSIEAEAPFRVEKFNFEINADGNRSDLVLQDSIEKNPNSNIKEQTKLLNLDNVEHQEADYILGSNNPSINPNFDSRGDNLLSSRNLESDENQNSASIANQVDNLEFSDPSADDQFRIDFADDLDLGNNLGQTPLIIDKNFNNSAKIIMPYPANDKIRIKINKKSKIPRRKKIKIIGLDLKRKLKINVGKINSFKSIIKRPRNELSNFSNNKSNDALIKKITAIYNKKPTASDKKTPVISNRKLDKISLKKNFESPNNTSSKAKIKLPSKPSKRLAKKVIRQAESNIKKPKTAGISISVLANTASVIPKTLHKSPIILVSKPPPILSKSDTTGDSSFATSLKPNKESELKLKSPAKTTKKTISKSRKQVISKTPLKSSTKASTKSLPSPFTKSTKVTPYSTLHKGVSSDLDNSLSEKLIKSATKTLTNDSSKVSAAHTSNPSKDVHTKAALSTKSNLPLRPISNSIDRTLVKTNFSSALETPTKTPTRAATKRIAKLNANELLSENEDIIRGRALRPRLTNEFDGAATSYEVNKRNGKTPARRRRRRSSPSTVSEPGSVLRATNKSPKNFGLRKSEIVQDDSVLYDSDESDSGISLNIEKLLEIENMDDATFAGSLRDDFFGEFSNSQTGNRGPFCNNLGSMNNSILNRLPTLSDVFGSPSEAAAIDRVHCRSADIGPKAIFKGTGIGKVKKTFNKRKVA
ncbi:hypothetical protein AYI70_g12269, partial [Smittium culicis]